MVCVNNEIEAQEIEVPYGIPLIMPVKGNRTNTIGIEINMFESTDCIIFKVHHCNQNKTP